MYLDFRCHKKISVDLTINVRKEKLLTPSSRNLFVQLLCITALCIYFLGLTVCDVPCIQLCSCGRHGNSSSSSLFHYLAARRLDSKVKIKQIKTFSIYYRLFTSGILC